MNLNNTIKKLKTTSELIAIYLISEINENGFSARTYYGESFAIALLDAYENKYSKQMHILNKIYNQRCNAKNDDHWEFNLYAMQEVRNDISVPRSFRKPIFIWKKVTNWVLLRSLVEIRTGKLLNIILGILQTFLILTFNMDKNGKIYDDYITRNRFYSDQYQAYSIALLGELFQYTHIGFIKKNFINGLEFILKKNTNPDIINEGRGKNQIFGYACIIYSLALAYNMTLNKKYLNKLNIIFDYLTSFQRIDGSFPLVLSNSEKGYPKFQADSKFPGWESYNNYFDYLPFLGYYLRKSYELLIGND